MPVVFRSEGLRFFFYSDEGTPREPPHIHVRQGGREAKLWLRRDLAEAYNRGFNARELRHIRALIEAHREQIETTWNEFFD
ncbi:MAG TPA: DUF4160 domain-containing protein [Rhizomicrobium sp.]|jgi:hypothetical protein|nr:DUF4160 domain-containing protein [Rhizomicrobium sp.]